MEYKIKYKTQNKMAAQPLSSITLDGEIGRRFDRFSYERSIGDFAFEGIIEEAYRAFEDKYDDEYGAGMWRSEFWGKLMLSTARVASMRNDKALNERIRRTVYKLIDLQEDDGYLSTYMDRRNVFGAKFDDPTYTLIGWNSNWNIWGQKYTLWALLECALLLDDEKILSAAKKLADNMLFTLDELGICATEAGVQFGMAAGSVMKPMLILYRLTAEERYLSFAKDIARDFEREDGRCPNLIANSLAEKPVYQWYPEAEGWGAKAYEMMSCFDGICELYRLTGDEHLLAATEKFWELVRRDESNILGSVGYCERFSNAAAYPDSATEVCDAIHWMRLSYELFLISGKIKYIEVFESAFLNAFLAGVYEDGRWGSFFVRSSGRHWSGDPQCETKYQHCCVNNVPRGFVNAAQTVITSSGDDYYVNSYLQSTVRLGKASFRISSGYTDKGTVNIIVRGLKCGTKLYLRAPIWSKSTEARMMSSGVSVALKAGEYTPVCVDADLCVINLRFDMTPRVIPFEGVFNSVPDSDYHISRWIDPMDGPCNKHSMVKSPMCTVRRGPVILARSKKIGSTEEEMFSSQSILGKDAICTATFTRKERMLALCYVKIVAEGEERTVTMCDLASCANLETNDPRYFSVFI